VLPGAVLRIMTGAPLPPGADAVVPVEDTRPGDRWVEVLHEVAVGDSVRPAGTEARRGDRVLPAGSVLRAGELGLLASCGYTKVVVYQRPTVAILSTGNELVPVEEQPGPGQIRNSNAAMLGAQVLAAGGTPIWLPVARDTPAAVREALAAAQGADLIVSSGGVSVGDYDVVRKVLEEHGALAFWRVRMRPGKPLAFALLNGVPFLGLPGNAMASFVTFELFARPALRKMAGHTALLRRPMTVRLDEGVPSGHERRHYARAVARWEDDGCHARMTGAQGSHLLLSTVAANALIVVPEGSDDLAAGALAQALLLEWPESP
jgi:molybdopterin molybdotransferase